MENRRNQRFWASLTMTGLIITQFMTGVFPVPIAPISSASAAGFFIEKNRDDAPEDEPVAPGDTIRYEIIIQNNDTKTANARIIDPVPPQLTFVSGTNGCSYVSQTDEVICAQQPLNVGDTRTVKLTFQVKNNVQPCTTIENQADVWNDDANPPSGIAPAWSNIVETPTECPDPELEVTKTANKSSLLPGDVIKYTIKVENVGDGTAKDVVVTDQIPSGLLYNDGESTASCQQVGNTVECPVGDIDDGDDESVVIAFTVDPSLNPNNFPCGSNVVNQATGDGSNVDPALSNSVSTPLTCPSPDIEISKSADKSTAEHTDLVEYTIHVENNGTGDAQDLTVTDPLPANTMYLDGQSDSLCNLVGSNVVCGPFDLDAGDFEDIDIVVKVLDSAPCDQNITNYATVAGINVPNEQSNSVNVKVECNDPEIEITKSVDDSTPQKLDVIKYTIHVENNGTGDAEDITVVDPLPTNTMYLDGLSDSLCNLVGSNVVCGTFDLNAGDSRDIVIAVKILDTASCGQVIPNKADVEGGNIPTTWSNQVNVTVECDDPSFEIVKRVDKTTVAQGGRITYEIEIENTGPVTLGGTWVFDSVPANTTFNDGLSDSRCFLQGNEVRCGDDSIQPGDTDTYTLVFDVSQTAPCGSHINNSAYIVFIENNNLDGNTNTVTTTVTCVGGDTELEITKSADRATVNHLDIVTYTLRVENVGAVTATDVQVVDPLPAHLMYLDGLSDSLCQQIAGDIVCGTFDLDAGDDREIEIAVKVLETAPCDYDIVNDANTFADNAGTVWSNDVDVTVLCDDTELTLTKTADRDEAGINDIVKYTLVVKNVGNTVATNVEVIDQVIPELSFQSGLSSSQCSQIGGDIVCGPVNLNPGQSKSFIVAFKVTTYAACDSTIYNQAQADADNADPALSNSESVDIVCEDLEADLEIKKSGPGQIMRGTTIVYTLELTNHGPNNVTDAEVIDPIPDVMKQDNTGSVDLVFNPGQSDPKCEQNGSNIECGWGYEIDAGETITIDIAFDVPTNARCAALIVNEATISSELPDPRPSNNTDEATSSVQCATNTIDIRKDGPATARHGDLITYTVTVENNNSIDVTRVRVIDPVPDNLQYVSADDSLCQYVAQTDEVICGEFDLDAGEQRSFELTFRVLSTARCNDYLTNIADVWSEQPGINPQWSNPVRTKVLCDDTDFEIEKDDYLVNAEPGERITYTIRVTNTSANDAFDVEITDELPPNVIFIYANRGGVLSNGVVTWIADIAAGDTETFTLQVEVFDNVSNGTVILNEACVAQTICDDDTTIIVVDEPELTITKTDNRSTVHPGETLTYEIDVTNVGSQDAFDVEIVDTLPDFVTFQSADRGGSFNNGEVTWFADIAAGDTEHFEVTVKVDNNAQDGTFLYNFVEIIGGPSDDDTTKVVVDEEEFGCIDVKKETFDTNGNVLTPVTQFTFKLDGGTQTVFNDSNGNARFTNVPVGTHTVTETVPNGWTQTNVTPSNGQVNVLKGNTCVTVTFKNKQNGGAGTTFTIDKTDDRSEAKPNDTLIYRITVRNAGSTDASTVTVTDNVPSGTTFVSAGEGGVRSGNTVTWTFSLNAGASKTVTMNVKVDSNARNNDTIRNTACVNGNICDDDTTTIDDNGDDDDDDNNNGEVQISVDDDPDPIDTCNDDDLEYEIRLSNRGNGNEEVDVIAILDGDTRYESSSDGGRERSNDRVEWDNVKVNRGSSRTLRLRVSVNGNIRDGDTLQLRVAESGGDEDTEITRVRNRGCDDNDDGGTPLTPDLTLDKTADRTEALAGSVVSYTITIRNTGSKDIFNATLTDDYPETMVTVTDPGGASNSSGVLQWNLGTLKRNSTTVVRYRVQLKTGLARGTQVHNVATVRGDGLTRTDDHTVVVPTPPQTGLGGFLRGFSKATTFGDSIVTASNDTDGLTGMVAVRPKARAVSASSVIRAVESDAASTLPFVVWVTTIVTGLGMGGLFGRRFLF